jgi:hypothetical protein
VVLCPEALGDSIGHAPYQHLVTNFMSLRDEGLHNWLIRYDTAPFDFFYSIVAVLFLIAVPFVVRKFGVGLGLYVFVSLLIPLSGNVLVGIGRYASVLFPVFMLAGTIRSTRVHEAILVMCALLQTLFVTLLIAWYKLH